MGNTTDQGNAADDGDTPTQPPVIPGLHPETQELLTARYGAPGTNIRNPPGQYGHHAAVWYPPEALILGLIAAYAMLWILLETFFLLGLGFPVDPEASPHQGLIADVWTRFLGSAMAVGFLMLFALLATILVGGPLAVGTARALRTVRNQWVHVLGFAVAGFLTPAPLVLLIGSGNAPDRLDLLLPLGGAGALCAVVGRLAVWKLIEVTPPGALAP